MAAKFSLTIFVVLVATQVFSSNASCLYSAPPSPCVPLPSCAPPGTTITTTNSGSYVSGPAAAPAPVYYSSAPAPAPAPVYVGSTGSSGYYSAPLPNADCSVPPVFLPPPKFPQLPTIHAPSPLTIPLQVPSVIPVGKVCVCKAIQIQPSVIPVAKPCSCRPACVQTC